VTITQKYIYIKERFVMVYLITGPRGSGKTQQIIELANEKVKTTNGNVVLIKKSHRDTSSVNFNIRAICMADYSDITTLEELVGFLYGMVAGNHDIETIFIDGVLKQVDISVDNLPVFLQKINKISKDNNIEFYISVSLEKEKIPDIDNPDYKVLN
jgi:AAA+ ATPase superfamily predicted ATPase